MKHAYAPDAAPDAAKRQAALLRARRVLSPRPLSRQSLFEGRGWTILRLAADASLLALGNVAALLGAPAELENVGDKGLIWLLPPITLLLLAARRGYGDTIHLRLIDGIGTLLAATSLAAIMLIAGVALFDPSTDTPPLLARAWLFGTVYLIGGRVLLAWAQRRARRNRLVARPTLIVGAGQVGARVERRLREQPELGLLPIGYLDADPPPETEPQRHAPVIGSPDDLATVTHTTGARHVVLGFSTAPDYTLIPLVRRCETLGLKVSLVPRLFDSVNVRVALEHLGGLPLYGLHSINPKGWQFTVKHVLDRVGAALLVIVFSPLLLALTLGVRLSSPGPIFFRQRRIGRDGREFEMLKFRSMRMPERAPEPSEQDNVVQLPTDMAPGGVEGTDRRTAIGSFMRKTSLDELPQLLNVLQGDMSLVGPRPERPEFVSLFGQRVERYGDRHRVKSGMTGWAQVHGLRGKTSLQDRVEWDNYYIENWSLMLDFKILLLTVAALFRRAE